MNKSVVLHLQEAQSWKEKCFGLLGKKPYPLLIKTRFGIHTLGMQYPLDILILDSKNHIVNLKENLAPNRFFFWNPWFDRVLELPPDTIREKKLYKGRRVDLLYD